MKLQTAKGTQVLEHALQVSFIAQPVKFLESSIHFNISQRIHIVGHFLFGFCKLVSVLLA